MDNLLLGPKTYGCNPPGGWKYFAGDGFESVENGGVFICGDCGRTFRYASAKWRPTFLTYLNRDRNHRKAHRNLADWQK